MPYEVVRDEEACSAAAPWACKNSDTGEVMGCHTTEEEAQAQLRALYANVDDAEQRSKLAALFDSGVPEYRNVAFLDFEARNDGWAFEGLAAVYDQEADIGEWTEEFRRGAFRKPIAQGDNTRLGYDHIPHLPVMATIKGGTLHLKDDVKGLVVRAQIAQHYIGDAVRELINRGDIKGMSPGMVVGRGNSEITMRAKPHRAIRALKHLPEISLTPDPAYVGTSAELRSLWALQMYEQTGLSQQAFLGAYQQLESRATPPNAGTGDEEPQTPPVTEVAEQVEGDPPEQRSGVTDAQAEAAARKRRLQLLGLDI